MMKVISINFLQKGALELGMDLIDCVIVRWMINFLGTEAIQEVIIDNKTYGWINYNHILEQLPILGITSKRAIISRISALVEKGVLEKAVHGSNGTQRAFFRVTKEAREKLLGHEAKFTEVKQNSPPPSEARFTTPVNDASPNNIVIDSKVNKINNSSMLGTIKHRSEPPPKQDYFSLVNEFFSSLKQQEWFKDLQEAFPDVATQEHFARARLWLLTNPRKRKKDLKRFLYNWLAKEQERVDRMKMRASQLSRSPAQPSSVEQAKARIRQVIESVSKRKTVNEEVQDELA